MNRSRRSISFLILVVLLTVSFCAKEEVVVISKEKIPITTTSSAALNEFQTGLLYANKVQRVQAGYHFQRALDADPTFATAWLNLAFVSSGTAAFISTLDSAKRYAPQTSEGEQLVIKAAQYGFEGNTLEQERTLEKLVEMYPGDETAHLALGSYYFGLQQYQKAILAYTQATQLNNDLAILHNQLGYSQRALGNYGEAEKAFKFYIKLNAQNPNAYDSYAELLMEMGRFNESIEFYAKALDLDPNFVASHIGIACDYAFLGEPERARTQLDVLREIANTPNETRNANFTEALTYVCEGDLPSASQSILSNFALSEELGDVGQMANDLIILGNLSLEMERPGEAIARFNQCMEVINGSDLPQVVKDNAGTTHLFNLARGFAVGGEFQKARDTATLFAKQVREGNNPIQIKLISQLNGIIALLETNYETAIEELSQANQMNPYNLFRIGEAYEALGDTERATSYKQQAAELNVLNSMDQAIVLSKTKFLKDPT